MAKHIALVSRSAPQGWHYGGHLNTEVPASFPAMRFGKVARMLAMSNPCASMNSLESSRTAEISVWSFICL